MYLLQEAVESSDGKFKLQSWEDISLNLFTAIY